MGLIADPVPVTINPAMMVHPNADADWTNVHACSVYADTRPNGANVGSDARSMPASTTRMIHADAADDRARLGRHESDRRSREAQSKNYLLHM